MTNTPDIASILMSMNGFCERNVMLWFTGWINNKYIFFLFQPETRGYSEKENPSSPDMSRAYEPPITSSDILQLSWELDLAQIPSGRASKLVIGRS